MINTATGCLFVLSVGHNTLLFNLNFVKFVFKHRSADIFAFQIGTFPTHFLKFWYLP